MSEETIKCPKCGKEIKKNQKFCTECGYVLDKKIKTLRILVIIAIIVLFIAILILNLINISYKQELPELQETQITKTVATLNQVLSLAEALGNGNYKNTDDIIQNGIKGALSINKELPDGVELTDGTIVKFEKLRDNCSSRANGNYSSTACANIYVTTSVPFIGDIKFQNDQKTVTLYLYKKEVVY